MRKRLGEREKKTNEKMEQLMHFSRRCNNSHSRLPHCSIYLSISENVFFGFQKKSGFRVLQSMWDFCLKEIVFITFSFLAVFSLLAKVQFNENTTKTANIGFWNVHSNVVETPALPNMLDITGLKCNRGVCYSPYLL